MSEPVSGHICDGNYRQNFSWLRRIRTKLILWLAGDMLIIVNAAFFEPVRITARSKNVYLARSSFMGPFGDKSLHITLNDGGKPGSIVVYAPDEGAP